MSEKDKDYYVAQTRPVVEMYVDWEIFDLSPKSSSCLFRAKCWEIKAAPCTERVGCYDNTLGVCTVRSGCSGVEPASQTLQSLGGQS